MSTYDEAAFYQELKRRAKFNTVTNADVEQAMWAAAPDLVRQVQDLPPEQRSPAAQFLAEKIVPALHRIVRERGYRLIKA